MSHANVEIVRRASAFTAIGDFESGFLLLHPSIEWVIAKEHPDARTLVGHEAVAAYRREWQDTMPDVRSELQRYVDLGDRVLAVGTVRGHGVRQRGRDDRADRFSVHAFRRVDNSRRGVSRPGRRFRSRRARSLARVHGRARCVAATLSALRSPTSAVAGDRALGAGAAPRSPPPSYPSAPPAHAACATPQRSTTRAGSLCSDPRQAGWEIDQGRPSAQPTTTARAWSVWRR